MAFTKKLLTTGMWQATNKWLKNLRDPQNDNLAYLDALRQDPYLIDLMNDLRGYLAIECGVTGPQFDAASGQAQIPDTGQGLWENYCDVGIPWQVYSGKLTHPRMVRVAQGGTIPAGAVKDTPEPNNKTGPIYVRATGYGMRSLAHKLRKKLYDARLVQTKLIDIGNMVESHKTNPGGIANATQD